MRISSIVYFLEFGGKDCWKPDTGILHPPWIRQLQSLYLTTQIQYNKSSPRAWSNAKWVEELFLFFFFAMVLQSFPWKVFLGKLSIRVKTVEKMVLLNSSPTLLCHRPCFSKEWMLMLSLQSVAACRLNWSTPTWGRKEWLRLAFQGTCWASSIRHSEGAFSEQYVHVTPNLDVLTKIHDRKPKAFQVTVELATDGESFLAAVQQKRKRPPAI